MAKPTPSAPRVLFTIPNLDSAGSARVMVNLIEEHGDRIRPTVCISRHGGHLEDVLRDRGVEIIVHPFTVPVEPKATLLPRLWAAAQPFRGRGFDLWHSYHYIDDFTEPIIARLSGARAWVYTKKNMAWTGRGWQARSLLSTRIAALNSVMMRDYFGGRFLRGRATLIPRGIVPSQWVLDPAEGVALRDTLGIAHDAPVVASTGTVTPRKGQLVLARAMDQLPDVHVIQVGRTLNEEYEAEVRAALAEVGASDRFHWLEHTPRIHSVLAAADIFCLPTVLYSMYNSRQRLGAEGLPVGLLEAMAAGLASVTTDVPGGPDVIDSGVNGIVVPPDDPVALGKALRGLVDDPEGRRRMARLGQRRMDRYTVEREAAAYDLLYADALAHSVISRVRRR